MDITLYQKIQDPVAACEKAGNFFAKSGMFGCDKAEQGFILALECFSTGKPPSVIARTYHIMDGKLSKKALAGLAEFRGMGGKHKWIKDGTDGKEAVIELTLDGNTILSRFNIEEAKAQGLIRPKSNWEKTPANMLRARAISNGVAMLAPEIYAGDVEDEPTTQERGELLQSRTAPNTPKPESAPVVDVPATVVTEPEKPQSAPVEAISYSEADIEIDPATQRLSNKAMMALGWAIGEANWDAAIQWCKNAKWIQSEISELTVGRARRIIKQRDSFVANLGKGGQ